MSELSQSCCRCVFIVDASLRLGGWSSGRHRHGRVFSERARPLSEGANCRTIRRDRAMAATVLTVSSRALIRSCEALGLDVKSMLDAAGVARAVIDDPDARIEVAQVRALWARAYEISGDPDLALHAAEALPFGAYKVIDFLASSAPTIGDSLSSTSKYFPLINTAVELPIDVGTDFVHFGARAPSHPAALTRPYAEYLFAAVFLRTRIASGVAFPLQSVEFAHPAPPSLAEHERVFGCPVRFGAEACRMIVARNVWDTALVESGPRAIRFARTNTRRCCSNGCPRTPGSRPTFARRSPKSCAVATPAWITWPRSSA